MTRRCRLKPEEKRQIAASAMSTRELAKSYGVAPSTIRAYRPTPPRLPRTIIETADSDAMKTLIDAYENGRWARRNWGDGAVCHYKGQHATAWRLGYESK